MLFRDKPYVIFLICTLLIIQNIQAQTGNAGEDLSLGTITFPTSGDGEAEKEFLIGTLALHNFWYPEARDHFRKARMLDPGYAMAYWGEALTHDHPLWSQHDRKAGAEVLAELDDQITNGSVRWTEREKAYVQAVRVLYSKKLSLRRRRKDYAEAMMAVAEHYPKDDEATAFSSLARMAVSGFNFNDPDNVEPVAAVLDDLYQRNPEHPGALHYLIHLYDSKSFAELGLRAADDYVDVASSSSHAVHMPSHIYRRLGMWQKVVEVNIRAYQVSVEWQQNTDRPLKDRDYHAFQWLFDARIELKEFEKACEQITELKQLEGMAERMQQDAGYIPWLIRNFKRELRKAVRSDTDASFQCDAL